MFSLGAEDRALLRRAIAFSWLPAQLYPVLVRGVLEATGEVTLERSHEMGRWIAERELTTIHRIVVQFLSPPTLVRKCVSVWKHHHDTGIWEVAREGAVLKGDLQGWAVVDEVACGQVSGYIEGLVSRVGGPKTRVNHTMCRGRGDEVCRFEVEVPNL